MALTTLHVTLQEAHLNQQNRKQFITNKLFEITFHSLLNCSAGIQLAIDAAQLNVDTLCGGFAQESFKYLNYTDIKSRKLCIRDKIVET